MQRLPPAVDERFGERWGRRVVTIPLYLIAGGLGLLLLPASAAAALAVDAMRRSRRLATLRCVAGLTAYLLCEAAGILASFGLWLVRPVLGGGGERFTTLNLWLQRIWAVTLFQLATRLFGLRVEVTGQEAVRSGPLFLFARHASTLDTLLPAVFVSHPSTLRLAHVMKRELLWDPCLDIVGQRTRNAFVRRGSSEREKEIEVLRRLALGVGQRDGVVLFPEGTRFSAFKREQALKHLADSEHQRRVRRAQQWQHVLPPRLGGVLTLLETRSDVDVAFMVHVGLERAASLSDLWRGDLIGGTVRLHFWRVPSREIPGTTAERIDWLDAQWGRANQWIAAHTPEGGAPARFLARRGDALAAGL